MIPLKLPAALLLCALSLDSDLAGNEPPADTVVLTGARLIDGTGAGERKATIVLRGSRIERVLLDDVLEPASDALVVDLHGRFVVPGLIEAHTHLATDPSAEGFVEGLEGTLRRLLGTGITRVRDLAGDGRVLADLARRTREGDLVGPDVYFASLLAGPRYFGDPRIRAASRGVEVGTAAWAHALTEETDLEALFAAISELGSDGLKLYADLEPDLVARVTEQAHERGLRVWSHWVVQPERTRAIDAVRAGVDVVSHAYMPMLDATPEQRASSELVIEAAGGRELFEQMRDRGTVLDATLAAAARLPSRPGWVEPLACAADVVRAALAAGVDVCAGSDHPGDGDRPGLHLELELLQREAGLEGIEVIRAATRGGARALGIEDHVGTIEAGQEATLLVLDGDPTRTLDALATPMIVVKRGRVYSGPALRAGTHALLERFPTLDGR